MKQFFGTVKKHPFWSLVALIIMLPPFLIGLAFAKLADLTEALPYAFDSISDFFVVGNHPTMMKIDEFLCKKLGI